MDIFQQVNMIKANGYKIANGFISKMLGAQDGQIALLGKDGSSILCDPTKMGTIQKDALTGQTIFAGWEDATFRGAEPQAGMFGMLQNLNDNYTFVDSNNINVNTGEGNDTVRMINCDNSTVNAGRGNDDVGVFGNNNTVLGGSGQDMINVEGFGNFANGGGGFDVVKAFGDANLIQGGSEFDITQNIRNKGLQDFLS